LTYHSAVAFGYILAVSFSTEEEVNQFFPIVALPFMVVGGFMANIRSMGGHMFAYSY